MYITGIDPTVSGTDALHALGSLGIDAQGRVWIYIKADEALSDEDAVLIASDFGASQVDTTSTAPGTGAGKPVGVLVTSIASGSYGWACVYGTGADITLNVGTGAAAYTRLNSTGTGGRLDDDAMAGSEVIEGIVTVAAESGNSAQAHLTWPVVGRTL